MAEYRDVPGALLRLIPAPCPSCSCVVMEKVRETAWVGVGL